MLIEWIRIGVYNNHIAVLIRRKSMAYQFNYDYSKTLWMKMYLADPDYANNTSRVHITFEQALEIIKAVDNITQGIQKIIYLVGWQGLGHDDCFPEMEVVNEYLKRGCDATARDSLLWLFEEAKKYNTVVSVHGNISDEYAENASHREFVETNSICNDACGNPAVIEIFNGRNAYKTSYKQYWESGLFKKYFDRFCEVIPVREAGTVHLDNFCIAESLNPRTYVEEQDEARNKMLDYMHELGIDVTSEYTYREAHFRAEKPDHPIRKMFAANGEELTECHWSEVPMRTLGKIPATWWTSNMTIQECIDTPPALYSGHLNDKALMPVFYGMMHGEDIWMKRGTDPAAWAPAFIKEFCTYYVPYIYLNRYQRLSYTENPEAEEEKKYTVQFSDGVVSRAEDMSITKNGVVLKQGSDVILPLTEDNRTFIAYSENGRTGKWNVPDADFVAADVYEITSDGNHFLCKANVCDSQIELAIGAGQAVAVKAAD